MQKIEHLDYALLSDIDKQKMLDAVLQRKLSLNSDIDKAIQSTNQPNLKKVYQQVRNMPDIDLKDLENKEWVWNGGHLRSQVEIELYNRKLEQENYYQTTWVHDKNKPTVLMYIPPLLWLGLIFCGIASNPDVAGFAFLTFPLSFLISLFMYYFMNKNVISKAERYGVPYSDEDYRKAIFEKKATSGAIIGGVIGSAKVAHSGMKELKNPDAWKRI